MMHAPIRRLHIGRGRPSLPGYGERAGEEDTINYVWLDSVAKGRH